MRDARERRASSSVLPCVHVIGELMEQTRQPLDLAMSESGVPLDLNRLAESRERSRPVS